MFNDWSNTTLHGRVDEIRSRLLGFLLLYCSTELCDVFPKLPGGGARVDFFHCAPLGLLPRRRVCAVLCCAVRLFGCGTVGRRKSGPPDGALGLVHEGSRRWNASCSRKPQVCRNPHMCSRQPQVLSLKTQLFSLKTQMCSRKPLVCSFWASGTTTTKLMG